jgi:aminoglycoside 3-N-acetyltransferase
MAYSRDELRDAYARVGVGPGRIVLVTGNLGRLMEFERPGKEAVVEAHYQVLAELLGPTGTLVVPTASTSLCNTDRVFDPVATPSELGPLTEYVRTRPGARRSFHPFVSYAAIGAAAAEIIDDASRHAFGPHTPEGRLVEASALHVSIGLHSRFSTATNHHVEMVMGVPYRYVREYLHPVVRDGAVRVEPFYMHVRYMAANVQRDHNRRIFEQFERQAPLATAPVGRGQLYAYSIDSFYRFMTKALADDIYLWTKEPPDPTIYRSMM